jgi:DNA-binding transcriptional LysR family regulator
MTTDLLRSVDEWGPEKIVDPQGWPVEPRRTELLAEPFALAVATGHRFAERGEIDLAEAAGETWICTRADTWGARTLHRLAAGAGFVPRIIFRSDDYGAIHELVARNLGIAMLPALAWRDDSVCTVRLAGAQPYRRVLVLSRANDGSPLPPLALDCLAWSCADVKTGWGPWAE